MADVTDIMKLKLILKLGNIPDESIVIRGSLINKEKFKTMLH